MFYKSIKRLLKKTYQSVKLILKVKVVNTCRGKQMHNCKLIVFSVSLLHRSVQFWLFNISFVIASDKEALPLTLTFPSCLHCTLSECRRPTPWAPFRLETLNGSILTPEEVHYSFGYHQIIHHSIIHLVNHLITI